MKHRLAVIERQTCNSSKSAFKTSCKTILAFDRKKPFQIHMYLKNIVQRFIGQKIWILEQEDDGVLSWNDYRMPYRGGKLTAACASLPP